MSGAPKGHSVTGLSPKAHHPHCDSGGDREMWTCVPGFLDRCHTTFWRLGINIDLLLGQAGMISHEMRPLDLHRGALSLFLRCVPSDIYASVSSFHSAKHDRRVLPGGEPADRRKGTSGSDASSWKVSAVQRRNSKGVEERLYL